MSDFLRIIPKKINIKIVLAFIALLILTISLQSIGSAKFFLDELNYLSAPYYDLLGLAKAATYIISYVLSVVILEIAVLQKSEKIWSIFACYLFFSYFIDTSSQLIGNSSGFTKFDYALFLSEANNVSNLVIFLTEILSGLAIAVIMMIAITVIRHSIKTRLSFRWLFLIPLLFLPVLVAKMGVHYIAYSSYAAPVKMPIIIANYHLTEVKQPPRILDDVIIAGKNKTDNIIYILDESISATHLSINGYDKKTTPDLEELVKLGTITNFGIVNAMGNCSALSQLSNRIGLSPYTQGAETNFVATRTTLPTIYQFAKRAGYKTWLIDTQVKQGTLTNHLTIDDLKYIDEYFTNPSRIEDSKRDRNGLERLKKIMDHDPAKKKLIVFVKDGAHWPYLWRFPKDKEIFLPVQTSEYEPRVIENKEKLINTYANVMRYAVNDFLKEYITEINLNNSITFYSADHGQAFLEPDAKDTLTHCSNYADPPSSQVTVPLLIIENMLEKRYKPEVNKIYSQHQIFPSMLAEMGYSDVITDRYGYTLERGYSLDHKRWFYWSIEGDHSLFQPKPL